VIKKAELKDRLAIARKAFDKQIKEKEAAINKEVNCLNSGFLNVCLISLRLGYQ
jgi:hypothetical protein